MRCISALWEWDNVKHLTQITISQQAKNADFCTGVGREEADKALMTENLSKCVWQRQKQSPYVWRFFHLMWWWRERGCKGNNYIPVSYCALQSRSQTGMIFFSFSLLIVFLFFKIRSAADDGNCGFLCLCEGDTAGAQSDEGSRLGSPFAAHTDARPSAFDSFGPLGLRLATCGGPMTGISVAWRVWSDPLCFTSYLTPAFRHGVEQQPEVENVVIFHQVLSGTECCRPTCHFYWSIWIPGYWKVR